MDSNPELITSRTTPDQPSHPAICLRPYTPARVSLGRSGISLTTAEVLDLQLAHARARDAIHTALDVESLARELPPSSILLNSAAPDRLTYLRRPDLGRTLSGASASALTPHPCDLAIILADGLSATAVQNHSVPLLSALLPLVARTALKLGPLSIVTQARVAIADQIGQVLKARLSLVLIGERPGLSAPDSLGAYLTWNPRPGRTDAERNCISNIRSGGLDYASAAARILHLCTEATRLQLTGTALKNPAQHQLLA